METHLTEPDKVIIEQYTEGTAIYLISKGECRVVVSEESPSNSGSSVTSSSKKGKGQDN